MKAILFAALSFTALGAATQAAVIVTFLGEALEISETLPISRYDPVDLDHDGSIDFTFGSTPGFVGLRTEGFNRVVYFADPPPNLGGPIFPLAHGFSIGPTLDSQYLRWRSSDLLGGYVSPGEIAFASIVIVFNTGSSSAFPESGLRAPIGVEFEAADGTHYGYLDITAGEGYAGITLHGWAYETEPGVPIRAATVPEPSVPALLTIALTFFAANGRRRSFASLQAPAC